MSGTPWPTTEVRQAGASGILTVTVTANSIWVFYLAAQNPPSDWTSISPSLSCKANKSPAKVNKAPCLASLSQSRPIVVNQRSVQRLTPVVLVILSRNCYGHYVVFYFLV